MADFSTTGSVTDGGSQAGTQGSGSSDTFGSGIVNKVRERATAQLSSQKDRAFEGIGTVAQAVRQSTQQLRDQQHETLAGYVEQAADQIDRFARQLRDKDVTELLDDAQRLARRQPAIFVGSAFAVGLLGARFLKSSTRPHDDEYNRYSTVGSQRFTRSGDAGVSPSGGSAPVASGSTYSQDLSSDSIYGSVSEPTLTPTSAGTGTGGGADAGISSSSASGTTRARTGARSDSPQGGSSSGRGRRGGPGNERS